MTEKKLAALLVASRVKDAPVGTVGPESEIRFRVDSRSKLWTARFIGVFLDGGHVEAAFHRGSDYGRYFTVRELCESVRQMNAHMHGWSFRIELPSSVRVIQPLWRRTVLPIINIDRYIERVQLHLSAIPEAVPQTKREAEDIRIGTNYWNRASDFDPEYLMREFGFWLRRERELQPERHQREKARCEEEKREAHLQFNRRQRDLRARVKQRKELLERSRVYFFITENSRFVKIGVSSNVTKRLCCIQIESKKMHGCKVINLGDIAGSFELENAIHKRLTRSHHSFEWFRYTPAVKRFIETLLEPAKLVAQNILK